MGIADHSAVTLRIFGDDLAPAEVTALLGAEPTISYSKGDVRVGPKTGRQYIEKTGRWSISADQSYPEDIVGQILGILSKLTNDLSVWEQLKSRYAMDFFCGVFMGSSNDGLEFTPEFLGQLSSRGITLGLDIYGYSEE